MSDTTSDLRPGERCGDYELLAFIGRGGMAQVWSARDLRTGEVFAIKTLLRSYAGNDILQERLVREGQSQQTLRHPNILRAYGTFLWNGTNFIVMDLVDGESLERYVLRRRVMPVPEVRGIAQGVLSALAHAHAHNIVHRDVKPSNILLSRQGRILLGDFGIALLQNATRLTTVGGMGTPSYMSPEQIVGKDIDHLSDIYSVGCVLYELLTGLPPFHAEGPEANDIVRNAHRFVAPEPLRPKNPDIPPALEAAVLKALEKKPWARFQSCAEFGAALGLSIRVRDAENADAPARSGPLVQGPSIPASGPCAGQEISGPSFTPIRGPGSGSSPTPAGMQGEPVRRSGQHSSYPGGIATGPRVTMARPSSTPSGIRRSGPSASVSGGVDLLLHRRPALTGAVAIVLGLLVALGAYWRLSGTGSHTPGGSVASSGGASGAGPSQSADGPARADSSPAVPAAKEPQPPPDDDNRGPEDAAASAKNQAAILSDQVRRAYDKIQDTAAPVTPPASGPTGSIQDQRPAPLAPPPGVAARNSGVLQWVGSKGDRVEFNGMGASSGTLTGDPLPGVPVQLWVEGENGTLIQLPSEASGYRSFILHAVGDHARILWKTIGAGQTK